MLYAVIDENICVGVLELSEEQAIRESQIHQFLVDVTNAGFIPQIGWGFLNNSWDNPNANNFKLTKLAFRQRFTINEMIGILNAMNTNPVVKVLQDNLSVATFVDLKRSDTIAGIQYLYSQGLLTLERMNAILNTAPTDQEVYKGTL